MFPCESYKSHYSKEYKEDLLSLFVQKTVKPSISISYTGAVTNFTCPSADPERDSMNAPLWKTNAPLYNVALRQGLKQLIEYLAGPFQEQRVKTLYRCRVNGYSVLLQRGQILVNGQVFSLEQLDNADVVLKAVGSN